MPPKFSKSSAETKRKTKFLFLGMPRCSVIYSKLSKSSAETKRKTIIYQKLTKNYACRDTQFVIDISSYIIIYSSAPMKDITKCRI